ncbi:MAG: TIGR03087 family PEP-CTERM/XrtA system glycosyltransferase [Gammaproteobacteria bacterium]
MNILVVTQRLPYPPNKGEKIRTYHQIKWLCEQGHQITVACPIGMQEEWADLATLKQQLGIAVIAGLLPNKVLRLLRGLLRGSSMSEAYFYSPALIKAIQEVIENNDFELILLSASSLLPYAKALSQPILMDFMDIDSDKWAQYAERASLPMSWVYRRESRKIAELEYAAVQRAQACFLISDVEIALFKRRISANNIYRLGNGIDTTLFYPASTGLREQCSDDPILLFVGAMDYTPNIDAMIWFAEAVWVKFRRKYPQATLIIAGMNPSSRIQALGRMPGVEVTGFVMDILPYFHRADVFIAPFRIARGVQNKVLQAFACGLPTVSTRVGVEGIACQENEHYVQAETADDFVDGIACLLEDTLARRRLSRNAMNLIREHYSWDAQLSVLGDHVETCGQ